MNPIDPRVRSYVAPNRVRWPAPAPAAPVGAERLCTESIGQPTVWRKPLCVMSLGQADRPDASELLLDFGRELHGGLQLVSGNTSARGPVPLRVTFGESVAEALGTPNQDHAAHQFITHVPWMGIHEVGCTGFRFVRLELTEPGTHIELFGASAVTLTRPDAPLGAFESNDERINAVYQTSVDTLHLCMQQHLWDGIKRDRLVWAGDLHPEVITALNVFGGHAVIPESIDFLREDAPLPAWMNGFPTYSLWWAISLRDWWLYTGDAETLGRNAAYVRQLMENVIACVSTDGRESLPGRFLDWASHHSPDAVAVGSHALTRMALLAGADLLRAAGDEAAGQRLEAAADAVARHTPAPVANQQANALRVLAGLADPVTTNDSVFKPAPFAGLSPFYAYYVLEARAHAGDHPGALDLLRHYWGGMLDFGATSFWEHFDAKWLTHQPRPTGIDEYPVAGRPDIHRDFGDYCYTGFRHSLCHAWSSGPAAWLARHVLGVTPATPGFGRVRVRPQLGDLEWVRGKVPTPHGPVIVEAERVSDGGIETRVQLPDGVLRAAPAGSASMTVAV